ncbi:R.Pab1 family restriction endonuclease [Mycoplasma sp. 1012]
MKIKNNSGILELFFSSKNKGKFRWKIKESEIDFPKTFATTKDFFQDNCFLEWQISYDKDAEQNKEFEFVNYKNKKKNLFELSWILKELIENKMISTIDINKLIEKIKKYNFYFEEKKIQYQKSEEILIEEINFSQKNIVLPTFLHSFDNGINIEISIQKQQYASGFQPMVYLNIPISLFSNSMLLLGQTSKHLTELKLILNKEIVTVFMTVVKIFALCSTKHKTDILNILSFLKENI